MLPPDTPVHLSCSPSDDAMSILKHVVKCFDSVANQSNRLTCNRISRTRLVSGHKSELLQMIVNMARCQDVCFALLCYYLSFLTVESKIFSKSLEDISLVQKSTLQWREIKENNREKREIPSDSFDRMISPFIHSQNLTLTTTNVSLGGENDNEVFVTWAGLKNEVSLTFTLKSSLELLYFASFV